MLKKYLESTEFYSVLLVRHSIYWHSKKASHVNVIEAS